MDWIYHIFFTHHQLSDILFVSIFWLLQTINKVAINIPLQVVVDMFSILLGTHLGIQLLLYGKSMFNFLRTAKTAKMKILKHGI